MLLAGALSACGGGQSDAAVATTGGHAAGPGAREAAQAAGTPAPRSVADQRPPGYTLVMSEEFNGTTLNRSRWCTRYIYSGGPALQVPDAACQPHPGTGTLDWLGDEAQRYVDLNTAGEAMHVVSGGVLTLRATRTGRSAEAPYESALLRSKSTWRPDSRRSYYITARVWLPAVQGSWPAFWLSPGLNDQGRGVWPPEIDIFEGPLDGVVHTDRSLTVNVHRADGVKPTWGAVHPRFEPASRRIFGQGSMRGRWVESAVEWSHDRVTFFLDGRRIATTKMRWVDRHGVAAPPASLLLNLAIGGHWAGRHGIDDTGFPTGMQVDHVRVYQKRQPSLASRG